MATAGDNISLSCTVNITDPSLSPPTLIKLYEPLGHLIASFDDFSPVAMDTVTIDTVTMVSVYLEGVRTSQAGLYTCNVLLDNGEESNVTEIIIIKGN